MSAYLKNIKNEMDDRSGRYMKRRYQNKKAVTASGVKKTCRV